MGLAAAYEERKRMGAKTGTVPDTVLGRDRTGVRLMAAQGERTLVLSTGGRTDRADPVHWQGGRVFAGDTEDVVSRQC